jgi:hypothetical protein
MNGPLLLGFSARIVLPDCDISSPAFNHILEAESPRQVQFALKFLF